jgi:hypothetical protein
MKTETWEQREFNGIVAGIDVGYQTVGHKALLRAVIVYFYYENGKLANFNFQYKEEIYSFKSLADIDFKRKQFEKEFAKEAKADIIFMDGSSIIPHSNVVAIEKNIIIDIPRMSYVIDIQNNMYTMLYRGKEIGYKAIANNKEILLKALDVIPQGISYPVVLLVVDYISRVDKDIAKFKIGPVLEHIKL